MSSTNKIINFDEIIIVFYVSERQSKTEATGDTLKEAQSINQSLSALGNVINALTTGKKHVPYRDSLLTQLMADCLGGNAKTLMFVNVSPAQFNAAETNAALMFARRCKRVQNAATVQASDPEVAKLKAKVAQLQARFGSGVPLVAARMPRLGGLTKAKQ